MKDFSHWAFERLVHSDMTDDEVRETVVLAGGRPGLVLCGRAWQFDVLVWRRRVQLLDERGRVVDWLCVESHVVSRREAVAA